MKSVGLKYAAAGTTLLVMLVGLMGAGNSAPLSALTDPVIAGATVKVRTTATGAAGAGSTVIGPRLDFTPIGTTGL